MTRQPLGEGEDIAGLIEALGGDVDSGLVELAMTHRSFAYERGGLPTNERLEFLGDAVLGVVITESLYRGYPDLPEGQLAKLRAAVVNSRALAAVARDIGIGRFIKLGRGEQTSGGRDKSSILADAVEALIGAYYLDRGIEPTRELILRLFADTLDDAGSLGAGLDWKTSLQELSAERSLGAPDYVVVESGPDHAKTFDATVFVDGRARGNGHGNSKKEAEQHAAEGAWTTLTAEGPSPESLVSEEPAAASDPAEID